MAQVIQHPRAKSERVIQLRTVGRLPKSVISLGTFRRDRNFANYEAWRIQEEIAQTLSAAAEWEGVYISLKLKAEALKQRARGARP